MTIYDVGDKQFFTLSEAKKEMKKTGQKGYKTKVYANGDMVACGEISLKGSNKTFIANSPGNMKQSNY